MIRCRGDRSSCRYLSNSGDLLLFGTGDDDLVDEFRVLGEEWAGEPVACRVEVPFDGVGVVSEDGRGGYPGSSDGFGGSGDGAAAREALPVEVSGQ